MIYLFKNKESYIFLFLHFSVKIQVEDCNVHQCETIKKSIWSPWLNFTEQGTSAKGYTEKRYKFMCRAQTDDPSSIKFALVKEEERTCRIDGSCHKKSTQSSISIDVNSESAWTDWSIWSPCSQTCGGGTQFRVRIYNFI